MVLNDVEHGLMATDSNVGCDPPFLMAPVGNFSFWTKERGWNPVGSEVLEQGLGLRSVELGAYLNCPQSNSACVEIAERPRDFVAVGCSIDSVHFARGLCNAGIIRRYAELVVRLH